MLNIETIRRLVRVQLAEDPDRTFNEVRAKLLEDLGKLSRADACEVKAALDEYLISLLRGDASKH